MRFPHFRRRPPEDRRPGEGLASPRAWPDSGIGAEIEAFLTGRMVDHLAAQQLPVPAWAVINRLAHATRAELVQLVEGTGRDGDLGRTIVQPQWEASERFVAGHLLATTGSADDLWRVQRATLVPLELRLITHTKLGRLTAEQVLDAGVEALEGFRPGR
jgi:hypothetical protein